jgi:hypothetical protein
VLYPLSYGGMKGYLRLRVVAVFFRTPALPLSYRPGLNWKGRVRTCGPEFSN